MVNVMFPNGKTSNCRNRKGLNAVEKKVTISLPINYSDAIFEVVLCYKSVYSNDDISSAYGQIANAMGYIEHYCRKAEKTIPLILRFHMIKHYTYLTRLVSS